MTDRDGLAKLETTLHQKIRVATEAAQTPLSPEDVTNIVREVVSTLSGDITVSDLKFYAELEELAGYIRHAKQEIAAIQPKDISASHIPHATDELDAVVGATEEATNKIMDVCDTISSIAGNCTPEISDQLVTCTTRIFEACNFQDITGQRITKVVQTLKYIDTKVEALLKALGEEIHRDGGEGLPPMGEVDAEKALLNGPQLPHKAIDQDEIDRMLSEF
ncbi:MAG: protein phosphatase CheZ [Alphaproteobacteria bacterium]|nr:protein phosphatase CheZ [Alphaproteobacteria bacterium]